MPLSEQLRSRMLGKLQLLYGGQAENVLERIARLLENYPRANGQETGPLWHSRLNISSERRALGWGAGATGKSRFPPAATPSRKCRQTHRTGFPVPGVFHFGSPLARCSFFIAFVYRPAEGAGHGNQADAFGWAVNNSTISSQRVRREASGRTLAN